MGRVNDDKGRTVGLRWTLTDPGMGLLERAGLAALYMTLRAAEEQAGEAKADAVQKVLTWDLSPSTVKLCWEAPTAAQRALEALFAFAWQVRDGVLYLPAVHRERRERDTHFLRLSEHSGILRTALQSNKTQPRERWQRSVETIDDDKEYEFSFQPLKGKLAPRSALSKLFRRQSIRDGDASATAWVMPGIEPRFADVEKTWRGPIDTVLLLMLAPMVCLYQEVQGEKTSELQVIPDIGDLEEFDAVRPEVRLEPVFVAGPSDAAATFLAEYTTRSLRAASHIGCRVVEIGIGGYYHPSNKTRKSVLDMRPSQDSGAVQRYRILHRVMPSRFAPRRDRSGDAHADVARPSGRFHVPSVRGRIADNLVNRRTWYADIAVPPRWEHYALKRQQEDVKKHKDKHFSIEGLWFDNLRRYQWRQLMELTNQEKLWQSDQERLFHEAFRKVLWRLVEREKQAAQRRSGSRTEEDRIEDLYDDLYRRLTRAKTRHLLRRELSDIMAEPPGCFSRPNTLRKRPDAIWAFMNDRHDWRKARDLALLTLASYGQFRGRSERSGTQISEGDVP